MDWQVLQKVDTLTPPPPCQSGVTTSTYVWGLSYVNDLVARDTDGTRTYVQQDANHNVTALVNTSGAVTLRFIYDPYGAGTVLTANWGSSASPMFEYGFQGGRLDSLSGLYNFQMRDYSVSLGRWFQIDPWGYVDGMNLYEMEGSGPVQRLDPMGLWDTDVHKERTSKWASSLGYPEHAAMMVGVYDEAVDGDAVSVGTGWAPIIGDQGYHFNRKFGAGRDSRLQHFVEQLEQAKSWVDWKRERNDYPKLAVAHLCVALHPLQDWVAHGDYGRTDDVPNGGTYVHHNASSWQRLPGKPNPALYPDDPDLDAIGSPDGRPAGGAILLTVAWHGLGTREYALYRIGNKRITLTEQRTKEALRAFRWFVRTNGKPCGEAWKYFGITYETRAG